jgi:hypothetical protein
MCHARTSDLHPVMAVACCLAPAAAAQCLLINLNETNLLELPCSNQLAGPRFGAGLDGNCG